LALYLTIAYCFWHGKSSAFNIWSFKWFEEPIGYNMQRDWSIAIRLHHTKPSYVEWTKSTGVTEATATATAGAKQLSIIGRAS